MFNVSEVQHVHRKGTCRLCLAGRNAVVEKEKMENTWCYEYSCKYLIGICMWKIDFFTFFNDTELQNIKRCNLLRKCS